MKNNYQYFWKFRKKALSLHPQTDICHVAMKRQLRQLGVLRLSYWTVRLRLDPLNLAR
jgi:hypothetical protein